jgi:ABC-type glycerol-3-phosphate transport system substrate-binding protein
MSTFQLVVISIFVAFIIIGVGTFALFGGVFGGGGVGQVTIWGTVPQRTVGDLLEALRTKDNSLENTVYEEKDPSTYEADLLNAMASGQAPDLFLVTQEQLGSFSDKIVPIPYGMVSQSEFVSSYIDEGQLFLTELGSLALPFMIDPMVMYWNRDLLGSAGVAQAPQYWNDFLELAPKLYSANSTQNITRSAVALGTWQNVSHAKAVLSTLFMQAGEFLTGRGNNGALVPLFGQVGQGGNNAAESALRFYTEFANPSKSNYSWNRSLPRSDEAFVGGQLATYFGFASEMSSISERNPNIRFGVAVMPQLQGTAAKITYGRLTGLAVPKAARNANGAAVVAQKLTSAIAAGTLAQYMGMPAARRDVRLDTSANAAADVFVQSALISRGWVDPSASETDQVFKTMIESVISGASEPATAVSEAAQEFVRLIPRTF